MLAFFKKNHNLKYWVLLLFFFKISTKIPYSENIDYLSVGSFGS